MQQTFQCNRCGAQNYLGVPACWNCGNSVSWQQQTPPPLPPIYQQPVNYQQQSPSFYQQQPDHFQQPQRRLNWFQRHLNWTWMMVILFLEPLRLGFTFSHITFPLYVWILFVIIYLAAEITVTLWALNQKSRSWVWVFIPIAVLFLSNNSNLNITV